MTRASSSLLLLAAFACLVAFPARAEVNADRESPAILVPYDDLEKALKEPRPRVLLPLEEYRKLLEAAERPTVKPPVEAAILEARYAGAVRGDVVSLEATFKIQCTSDLPVLVPLPLGGLSVWGISRMGKGALVAPAESGVEVILLGAGSHELALALVGTIKKEGARARLRVVLPPAAVSRFDLLLPEKGIDPRLEPEVSFVVAEKDEGTLISATLGTQREINLSWQPRVELVTELPASLYLVSGARVSVDETLVKADYSLDIRIAHAPVRELQVEVPEGYSVVSVTGEGLRAWTVAGTLVGVSLLAPVADAYRLNVEVQRVRAREEKELALPAAHVRGSEQEQGYFAIRHAQTLLVRPRLGKAVAQIDLADLPPALAPDAKIALRYLARDFEGELGVSELEPELRVAAAHLEEVSEDETKVRAALRVEVRQTGVLRAVVGLPADAGQVDVRGDKVAGFDVQRNESETIVAVEFSEKVLGGTTFEIAFVRPHDGKQFAVAPIRVEGAHHHEGWVALRVADVFTGNVTQRQGLRTVPAAEALAEIRKTMPDVAAADLGLRYVEAPYAATVALVRKKPFVSAQVATLADVKPDHVTITYDVDYAIQHASVEMVRVALPDEAAKKAHLTGALIKEKRLVEDVGEPEGFAVWEARLQRPAEKSYHLKVEIEEALEWRDTGEITSAAPELIVLGVDRESGALAVARDPRVAVRAAKTENLESIDYRELPPGLQVANVFLGYRYYGHPYASTFTLEKGVPAPVVGTLINYEVLVAALAADGSCTTDVMWEFQNNARQELAVELPAAADVLLVEVGDQEVTPARRPRDNKLVVPIPRTREDERKVVHLAYIVQDARGTVTPAAPEGVPVVGCYWRVHVAPKWYPLFFRTPLRLANEWRLDWPRTYVPVGPVTHLGVSVFDREKSSQVSRPGEIRVHLDPRSRQFAFVGPGADRPLEAVLAGVLGWRALTFLAAFAAGAVLLKLPRIVGQGALVAVLVALIVVGVVAEATLAALGWAALGALAAILIVGVLGPGRRSSPAKAPMSARGAEGGPGNA